MNAPPPQSTSSLRKLAILVFFLSLFFIVLTCCFQLRTTEAAILTTFEKPVKTVTQPGLHFKLPWPIQKAYTFDLRTRLYRSKLDEFLIKDGFQVQTSSFVCWSINDVDRYKNKVGVSLVNGEAKIGLLISKNLKSTLSTHTLSDLVGINTSKQPGKFTSVEQEVLKQLQAEAKAKYGIKISIFGFNRFALPETASTQVFERMKAERMKKVEKILSDGKQKAATIKKEADSQKNKIIAEAEAEAIRIRGKADTEAFEYLSVYNKHPEFALFLKKLKALENTVKHKTTIIIDKETPPFDMLSRKPYNLKAK